MDSITEDAEQERDSDDARRQALGGLRGLLQGAPQVRLEGQAPPTLAYRSLAQLHTVITLSCSGKTFTKEIFTGATDSRFLRAVSFLNLCWLAVNADVNSFHGLR